MSASETFGGPSPTSCKSDGWKAAKAMRRTRRGVKEESQTLIRVRRCHKCKTQFMIGDDLHSSYYKACRCGRSDLLRNVQLQEEFEWTPMNSAQILQDEQETIEIKMPAPGSTFRSQRNRKKRFLQTARRLQYAWHSFSRGFQIFKKEKRELVRKVITEKSRCIQQEFWNPTVIIPHISSRPRRFRKSPSLHAWFHRFSNQFSSVVSSRRKQALVTPKHISSPSFAWEPYPLNMADTQRLTASTKSLLTFENPAFEKEFEPEEENVRKRKESPPDSASLQTRSVRAETILQNNFTIGSTSSLIVAMLSHASFAYFILWFVLYCSTLHVILPEMKYLHRYVTLCSLILMTGLNVFRFYICLNADKNQNSYLFTGTKTLTVLVIGALTSLLVTDAYAEPPRSFHIIISSILMGLLVSEGIAILFHHRLLLAIIKTKIDSTRPSPSTISLQPRKAKKSR